MCVCVCVCVVVARQKKGSTSIQYIVYYIWYRYEAAGGNWIASRSQTVREKKLIGQILEIRCNMKGDIDTRLEFSFMLLMCVGRARDTGILYKEKDREREKERNQVDADQELTDRKI